MPDYRNVREATPEEQQAYRDKQECAERMAWEARLAKAYASIPKRFAWVPVLSRKNDVYVIPDALTKRLPWITPTHLSMLREHVEGSTNVLICGPYGTGKTTLMTIVARWYLRAAEYDHPKIRVRREACAAHRQNYSPSNRDAPSPRDPDALKEVWRARGLRFVSSKDLLTPNQRDINGDAVEAAQRASILLLDEVGEEMRGAERGKYLWSSRSPAVVNVIKERWNEVRRFFVTTPYDPELLDGMYEGGAFRRLVEDASCASVIDLRDDKWAGEFIRERAKKKPSSVKR